MQDKSYVPFTKEMKKDYTILAPNMLPIHFKLILSVLSTYGYHLELLETSGRQVVETGLKYTHNDACYPAVLTIGQFIQALQSGRYDVNKTALLMFQTGGGCRASNYIPLIRKALQRAGLAQVPVISFNLYNMEKHPGFRLTLPMLHKMLYAVLYGDLLMSCCHQVQPYESSRGAAAAVAEQWATRLGRELGSGTKLRYRQIKENYRRILADFSRIPQTPRPAVRVGIVGEIFVKFSPLANNDLEKFLVDEGAEVEEAGLFDFCIYSIQNNLMEYEFYRRRRAGYPFYRWIYNFLCRKKDEVSEIIAKYSSFRPWASFRDTLKRADGYISTGVKMGEGWLLAAEILEFIETGCKNIVCTQPFGCLPNHICGKAMMKPIRERHPEVNLVAIDYDPGASRVNQENRLKLMLFTARRQGQLPLVDC